MRAVLDPNVLVSALISPAGPPREIITAWVQGRFELIASPALLTELRDVLARPKFRRWVSPATAGEFADGLADGALVIDDPAPQPGLSPDPDDDYLFTLARAGVFRDGPTGRRAGLSGGPDVWEVVQVVLADRSRPSGLRAAAEWGRLSEREVRIAMRYYSEFPDEVDERIRRNLDEAHAAEAAWRREQAALH